MILRIEDEGDEAGACFDDGVAELGGEVVAEGGCTHLGDGEASRCDYEGGGGDGAGVCFDAETAVGVRDGENAGGELDADIRFGALAQEHVEDVVGGTVAEELAEGFFVIRDAVLFNQGDEVLRGEAGERGLGEVGVGGEEVFRLGVDVGEVAATAAGDENLFAGAVGVLEDEGVATAASSFDGAHEARSAGAKDEDVYFGHKVYCQRREARSYNGEASL